ncbi:hypothetical protein FOMG_19962 [Fusarium oxysporum f. sp. melonis 26406]|uniref:Uncharacterized protein n=1 Tax=Fusarium oxysporum f. sp. melonis 26406 TaxID=1089452 RepID=W9YUK7_FUSOX|nr:hypothetical protein FOMG_19962 [Fusarium oxysporum f. sp. melonis 26406]
MGAQDLLMVSCNLGAVGLLLSAEDLPLSSFLHLSSQSDAILNLLVFFLSTEDLPLKPIFARSCKLSWDHRSSSVHRRSPAYARLCRSCNLSLGSSRKLYWDRRSSSVHRRSPAYAHLCRSCDLVIAGLLSAEGPLPTSVSAGLEIFLEIAGLLSMIDLPPQSIFARSSRSAQP